MKIYRIALLCLFAFVAKAQTSSKEIFDQSLTQYYNLKDLLVAENPNAAQKTALTMIGLFNQMNVNQVPSKHKAVFLNKKNTIVQELEKLSKTTNIKIQRDAFELLSLAIYELYSGLKLNNNPVYLQYCPMAQADGAYWLSNEKEIFNPYYGKKMLHCGSVEKSF